MAAGFNLGCLLLFGSAAFPVSYVLFQVHMKRCELCSAASSRVCSFWDQSYAHFILLMLNSEMDCLCTEECLISFGLNGAVLGVSCLSPHGSWDGFSSPEKEGNEVDDGWIIKQSVFHFDTFLLTRMRGC